MRVGLVLGAGGATGWVFHAGVLRTIRDRLGFEPSAAEIVVGTSAGASVAVALRAGLDPDEIYRAVTRPPSPEEQQAMRSELRAARKTLRPLAPGMVRELLPGGRGIPFAIAGLLPPGIFPTGWLESFPGMDRFDEWPPGLWIPAVRVPDGETVVFGRDRRDVPLHLAVQASSAVPGTFRPAVIDGVAHVDGGVASSTHAHLLADRSLDLVIVSAPMSKPSRRPFAVHARRRLEVETAALREAGTPTVVVEAPGPLVEASRGFPRRNPGAAEEILGHAARAADAALAAV